MLSRIEEDNRNMQLRFEIAMTDIRDQLTTNDKFPELSERYSQDSYLSWFLELVEEVRHEINLTSKGTGVHNLHVIFKCL